MKTVAGQEVFIQVSDYGVTRLGIHQVHIEVEVDGEVVHSMVVVGVESYTPVQVDVSKRNMS